MLWLYILLGIGLVFSVVSIVLRRKAANISLVLQIVVVVVFACAIVWAILNAPHYNAFVQALTSRY